MDVIDVKIRDRRYVGRFKEELLDLTPKTYCLVEVDGDKEVAKVKSRPYTWHDEIPPDGEVFVIRGMENEDFIVLDENRDLERDAFRVCLDRIRERELPMSLGAVERSYDGKKMRFFFTADNRIDFRELVKDLASVYKTRIEMRQIGVRDRAKKIGGFGICGEELCCSRFLQKFEPITIRMAKEQNLALNPTKISGLCGRLMCCLSYEVDSYTEARRSFPPNGTVVDTPNGEGVITEFNYVKNNVTVRLDENRFAECTREELKILGDKTAQHKKKLAQEEKENHIDEELKQISDE